MAAPVVRVPVDLGAGQTVELEVAEAQGEASPVLHLWDPVSGQEFARAARGVLRGKLGLHYQNDDVPRRLELLVRPDRPDASGVVDLMRDGQPLLRAASLGGALLELAADGGITYLVTATPQAPPTASLWGLDADGGIVAHANAGGPTGLPRLASSPKIRQLLLAPLTAEAGRFNVYANDADDRDGDGVGRRLERALSTCDLLTTNACKRSALADFYRSSATGTRDTDRDGLSDGDELFGVNLPGLDLPRYGADPRHKDVFIEVDHDRRLPDVGFSARELSEIAALYAVGSADDLKNPDGLPGLRLHFDVGFAPSDPAYKGLFGDWGGSGEAQASEYRAARKQDFSAPRAHYFRYAFSTRRGRGQAHRDALTVNRDLNRVHIFAHELGHTLGLQHHGHDSWGKHNCKPNYFSIMNYLYQNHEQAGFSRSRTGALNPASAHERGALPRWQPASMLSGSPLELDVFGRDIDWNRDGLIEARAVRANLFWATFKSCGASESGLSTLSSDHVGSATPVLLSSRSQLLALWLDDTGQLWLRRHERQEPPEVWSAPERIAELSALRHIAGATWAKDQIALAYVSQDDALHLATFSVDDSGLHLASNSALPGAATRDAPALASFELAADRYGAARALGVLYRSTSGRIEQVWIANGIARRAALDAQGDTIEGVHGPSVTVLPSGERCAVFPDAQANMRFYCYETASDRWRDLSARAFDIEIGPSTNGATALAYHRFRDASGAAPSDDDSRGALLLAFSEPESSAALYPNNPHFYLSQWLSAQHGAREQISFRWRGRVISEWTQLAAGSGMALLEGEEHLQALLVQRVSGGTLRLDYLPYADGEVDETLDSGNDFQVMERGICLGLHSEAECGSAATAAY